MKLFTIVLLSVISFIQCLSEEKRAILKKLHMQCFEDTNVSPDYVLKLKSGNWDLDNALLKEWTLCVLKKYGLMSDEGVFKLDAAMSLVPDKATKPPFEDSRTRRQKTEENEHEENDALGIAVFLACLYFFL